MHQYDQNERDSMQHFNDAVNKNNEAITKDKEGQYTIAKYLYQEAKDLFISSKAQNENLSQIYISHIDKRISDIDSLLKNETNASELNKEIEDFLDFATKNERIELEKISGLDEAKQILIQTIIIPLKNPELFQEKAKLFHSIFLYGPPGTGKTMLGKAISSQLDNVTMFYFHSCDILYISEKVTIPLFKRAHTKSPSIIFIDDIDFLFVNKSRYETEINSFLSLFDEIIKTKYEIFLIVASSTPWNIDPTVIKRFERKVYIPLPDLEARKSFFECNIDKKSSELTENQINELSKKTIGFTGADLSVLIRSASMIPIKKTLNAQYFHMKGDKLCPCNSDESGAFKIKLNEMSDEQIKILDVQLVNENDFIECLKKMNPSISSIELSKFDQWTKEFCS